jgi:hypothetical protein
MNNAYSDTPRPGEPRPAGPATDSQASASETYGFVCGTALIVIGLLLIRRGMFPVALFPVGAGFLGLFFRWRIAPVLVIGITGACLIRSEDGIGGGHIPPGAIVEIQTWILCSALLTYVLAHYRLQALTAGLFPGDRRTKKVKAPRSLLERPRLGSTVGTGEVALLVLVLPFVTFAALLLLRVLPSSHNSFEFARTTWPTIVLIWVLALAVILLHAVLSYVGLRNLTVAAARTYLQDLQWLELRRDLRRIQRWRLRSRFRKDS